MVYQDALRSAGYKKASDPYRADFLLYDLEHEKYLPVLRHFSENRKPIFVYPHSANSWYFWDGFHREHPVSCNFVFTDEIKNAMIYYGYKSRIEACGFPFLAENPQITARPKTLLFAPMHTMGKEGSDFLRAPASFELNRKTLERVFQLAPLFDSVTVRYGKSFDACGMYDPHINNVHFEKAVLNGANAICSIQQHSTVIAAGTLGYISTAIGKPTIFFNQRDEAPREWNMVVKSYDNYRHFLDYPIQLGDMTDEQVSNFERDFHLYTKKIEQWRNSNIGSIFNARKFISVIREYLK
jgi:hypothetical protein